MISRDRRIYVRLANEIMSLTKTIGILVEVINKKADNKDKVDINKYKYITRSYSFFHTFEIEDLERIKEKQLKEIYTLSNSRNELLKVRKKT